MGCTLLSTVCVVGVDVTGLPTVSVTSLVMVTAGADFIVLVVPTFSGGMLVFTSAVTVVFAAMSTLGSVVAPACVVIIAVCIVITSSSSMSMATISGIAFLHLSRGLVFHIWAVFPGPACY